MDEDEEARCVIAVDGNGAEIHRAPYEALGSPSAATVRMMPVKLPHSTCQGFWTCAKQTGSDGFFNERERLHGFTRFRFGCLSAELHRRQLILNGVESRLSLLQSLGGVLQLEIDLYNDFTALALRSFGSLFGQL